MEERIQKMIREEREKLNRMIDELLDKHAPLSGNEALLKQGRYIERLIDDAGEVSG